MRGRVLASGARARVWVRVRVRVWVWVWVFWVWVWVWVGAWAWGGGAEDARLAEELPRVVPRVHVADEGLPEERGRDERDDHRGGAWLGFGLGLGLGLGLEEEPPIAN